MIHGVLFDLGGVFYVGQRLLPGAREALLSLRAAGIPTRFVTNTTRLTPQGVIKKLRHLGLAIPEDDLFTPTLAARHYLKEHALTPYLLVHPQVRAAFDDLTGGTPTAVLLGDAGDAFTYPALNTAFALLLDGAPLLAMGRNRYFHDGQSLQLDAGPFVTALEYAADTRARVLGKPSARFFREAVNHLGLRPQDVVMVGDDAQADIVGALEAGLQGILLRTGKYRKDDEAAVIQQGGQVLDNLDQAVDYIL